MRGASLIELLILFTVGAIAGILLVQILVQNNSVYYQQTTKVTQGLSSNEASSIIEKDIREASSIAQGGPEAGSPFTHTTGSSVVVLKIPAVDVSGNILSNTYDFIIITADSSNTSLLRRIISPNGASSRASIDQILSKELASLNFTYQDNSGNVVPPSLAQKIVFTINLSTTVGNKTEQKSATREVYLRND